MLINEYALAVEIDNGLFEIFDIMYFEKDTEIDLRYKKAAAMGAHAVYSTVRNGLAIGDTFENNAIVSSGSGQKINVLDDQNVYLFISDNKIFGAILNKKTDIVDEKYQAAFDSNVILIDISLKDKAKLGDVWDGQKIIPVI